MNTFDFTSTANSLTHTTKATSSMTTTSLVRTKKKEKATIFANPNVLQVHDMVIPKGKYDSFQELSGTVGDMKWKIEALKV